MSSKTCKSLPKPLAEPVDSKPSLRQAETIRVLCKQSTAQRSALYADLAKVAAHEAQAIATAKVPDPVDADKIRAKAALIYGEQVGAEIAAHLIANQAAPTQRALWLLARKQEGEHVRLQALALRLQESAGEPAAATGAGDACE